MSKVTKIAISHSDADLGTPTGYTRDQLEIVKAQLLTDLMKEGGEILSIILSSINTARGGKR